MQADLNDKELGKTGEEIGARYLEKLGFRILERNYRCRLGEVDLIVEKKGVLSFVEVKTRRSVDAVSPLELISKTKQVHISRVAQHYFATKKETRGADFALLIVDWSGPHPVCELIESAFPLAWGY
jgi:putative endonuclease